MKDDFSSILCKVTGSASHLQRRPQGVRTCKDGSPYLPGYSQFHVIGSFLQCKRGKPNSMSTFCQRSLAQALYRHSLLTEGATWAGPFFPLFPRFFPLLCRFFVFHFSRFPPAFPRFFRFFPLKTPGGARAGH